MPYANPLYIIKAEEIRNADFCTALVFSSQPTKCTPPIKLKSVKTDPKGLKTEVNFSQLPKTSHNQGPPFLAHDGLALKPLCAFFVEVTRPGWCEDLTRVALA